MLQEKVKEQEARSRQLEQQLKEMARKHADAKEQWKKRMSSERAETVDVDKRNNQDKLNTSKYDKQRLDKRVEKDTLVTSKYDKENLDKRDDQDVLHYDKEGKRRLEPSGDYAHLDQARYVYGGKRSGSDLYYDETEGKDRVSRRHGSYTDADTEESWREGRRGSSRRQGRGSGTSHHVDKEGHLRDRRTESPTGGRKVHEKSDRKTRKTREKSVEFENVVTKTHAAVTEVQVVRDDEVYRLSKGRIELLESEKSALMELNTSLQEENKALKQLALSLQKGTGEMWKTYLAVM